MGEIIIFYAIKVEDMEDSKKIPKAIRDFVKTYFKKDEVFQIPCFVAVETDYKSPWYNMDDKDFVDGLSEEELAEYGIFSWMENHPEIMYQHRWS